jgi:hypothetical protein
MTIPGVVGRDMLPRGTRKNVQNQGRLAAFRERLFHTFAGIITPFQHVQFRGGYRYG